MIKVATAKAEDGPQIRDLMNRAIRELQRKYLTEAQIEASFAGMGLDTQLIEDKTYFCVWDGDILVGCGGWSRRSTLHGGDHSADRDDSLLDPSKDPARIRAMYTHPEHTRRGIGRLIIDASEKAAKAEGFGSLTMAATLAGVPFYKKCGYRIESEWEDLNGSVPVPLCTMVKDLT